MTAWVLCDPDTGVVVSRCSGSAEQLAQVMADHPGRILEVDDAAPHFGEYLSDGELLPRPTHAAPSATAVAVGATVTWPAIAAGALVSVTGPGADGFAHAGGDLELAFDAPGDWRVLIAGPGPHMPREDVIHVG